MKKDEIIEILLYGTIIVIVVIAIIMFLIFTTTTQNNIIKMCNKINIQSCDSMGDVNCFKKCNILDLNYLNYGKNGCWCYDSLNNPIQIY